MTSSTCIVRPRKRRGFHKSTTKMVLEREFDTFCGNLRGFLLVKMDGKIIW
mgnify:CR=1 FL=1